MGFSSAYSPQENKRQSPRVKPGDRWTSETTGTFQIHSHKTRITQVQNPDFPTPYIYIRQTPKFRHSEVGVRKRQGEKEDGKTSEKVSRFQDLEDEDLQGVGGFS